MAVPRLMMIVALVSGLTVSNGLAETLSLDKKRSKIEFVGKKSDGQHDGGFRKFDAKAMADFENPEDSSLSMQIDATSLWADNGKLTNHLKNPDFFDVRKYPTITFESTKVVPPKDGAGKKQGAGKVVGKMTMLGETREVTVPVQCQVNDEELTLDADFSIDRTRWGMNYGEGKIDNKVDVKAHLVFKR